MVNVILAPSILLYDNCDLVGGVRIIENSGAQWIHIDVMDGHFVDNISFGPKLVADLRRHTDLFLDVHLMLTHPHRYLTRFIEAGADGITIHREASCNVKDQLRLIRERGCLCGLAIKPETALNFELLKFVDIALIMGVQPGLGGQTFMPEACDKVLQLCEFRDRNMLQCKISVDGGIRENIGRNLIAAGADIIVTGSAFFSNPQDFHFCLN
jgi:ribulose-phosphate 3-epimerase